MRSLLEERVHVLEKLPTYDRNYAVGDAAGVNVLYGEGIGPAFGYGKVAAQEIDKAFQTNNYCFKNSRRSVLASPMERQFLMG
jgi:flavin-dependent dehydrogenase